MHITPALEVVLKPLEIINSVAFISFLLIIELSSPKIRRRNRYGFTGGVLVFAILTILGASFK
jgi:hypothetical protein